MRRPGQSGRNPGCSIGCARKSASDITAEELKNPTLDGSADLFCFIARVVPGAQAFVRNPSLGRRLRYSHHSGATGAQRCEHDHDLHARFKPRRSWRFESAGQVMMAGCTPVRCFASVRRAVVELSHPLVFDSQGGIRGVSDQVGGAGLAS